MNLFIVWSGDYSKSLATALNNFLCRFFDSATLFFSENSIGKGETWREIFKKNLEQQYFVFFCLTRSNLHSQWLMYEVGVVSSNFPSHHMFPLYFDPTVDPRMAGPLSVYQATFFSKSEYKKLIISISEKMGGQTPNKENLEEIFNNVWPRFEKEIIKINNQYEGHRLEISPLKNHIEDLTAPPFMKNNRKFRVFLCHAREDKPIVRELYKLLLAEGWIDPWLDEEKLLPGQDWDLEIEKAVESSDAVIVCLSSKSVAKEGYIQKETRFVFDIADGKPEETIFVIPLRLEDCQVPKRLKKRHYVDYFPLDRRNWTYKRLLESLKIRSQALDISAQKPDLESGTLTMSNG